MLFLVTSALASGYHFLKVEALAGLDDQGRPSGGIGVGTWSDLLHAWATFGDPAADGWSVRQAWVESRPYGPVIGVVPPAFLDIVDPYQTPWLVPWATVHAGTDIDHGRYAEVYANQLFVLNAPAWAGVDPQIAYVGPAAGLGLQADWWRDWRDVPDLHVMTGKATGIGGVLGGITVRDTWYAQARALASIDLFGVHQYDLVLAGTTGLFLDRVVAPVGLELSGELGRGNENVHVRTQTRWAAKVALFWKLVPPYRTRLEEEIARKAAARTAPE